MGRWQVAQTAEAKYWEAARQDEPELLRIVHEKAEAIAWARNQVPAAFQLPGPWVEVGIGPIGIGCVHLVSATARELIGVDPLSPVDLPVQIFSPAFRGLIAGCHDAAYRYRHVIGRGENLELPDESAALAICYNVLDHCDDPEQVVREVARVLQHGAHFVLGCDVYSFAGRVKYRVRRGIARIAGVTLDSIADLAHPHQFVARDLEGLVNEANLDILSVNIRPSEIFKRVWGHSHRMLIVARKRDT